VLRGKGTKSSIKRSKARLAVGVSESTRLHKVLQHPSFKADPVQVRADLWACVLICGCVCERSVTVERMQKGAGPAAATAA
jgi:hypothetical protein